jgi:hypothetical protein
MTDVSCTTKMSRFLLVLHLCYFAPGAILTSLFTSTRLTIAISGLSLLDTSMSLRKLCQSTMASMRKPGQFNIASYGSVGSRQVPLVCLLAIE